jgi:hypothetical protein
MPLHGLLPIVPHHIDATLGNLSQGEIPVTGVLDIRLITFRSVNHEFPTTEFNLFSLQGDHTFEKHHFVPGKADHDYITLCGLKKEVLQPPTKIDRPIVICGLHTVSPDAHGDADIAEKEIRTEGNQ